MAKFLKKNYLILDFNRENNSWVDCHLFLIQDILGRRQTQAYSW